MVSEWFAFSNFLLGAKGQDTWLQHSKSLPPSKQRLLFTTLPAQDGKEVLGSSHPCETSGQHAVTPCAPLIAQGSESLNT
jgi:hypothetical protein